MSDGRPGPTRRASSALGARGPGRGAVRASIPPGCGHRRARPPRPGPRRLAGARSPRPARRARRSGAGPARHRRRPPARRPRPRRDPAGRPAGGARRACSPRRTAACSCSPWPSACRPATAARLAAALDDGRSRARARRAVAAHSPARVRRGGARRGRRRRGGAAAVLLDRLAYFVDLASIAVARHRRRRGRRRRPRRAARAPASASPRCAEDDAACRRCRRRRVARHRLAARARCLRCARARALAALDGARRGRTTRPRRSRPRWSLAPRATTRCPAPEEPPTGASRRPTETRRAPTPRRPRTQPSRRSALEDIVLEAARGGDPRRTCSRASRPARRARATAASAGKAGDRPACRPCAAGRSARGRASRARARLTLVATLRAAAPWQRLRRREHGPAQARASRSARRLPRRPASRRSAATTTIFVVDASGSSPLQPARRGQGRRSSCCSPTATCAATAWRWSPFAARAPRSCCRRPARLARAKRSLAGLPGGGGTPLARGLDAAVALAGQVRRHGADAVRRADDRRPRQHRPRRRGRAAEGARGRARRRRGGCSRPASPRSRSTPPPPSRQRDAATRRLAEAMGARLPAAAASPIRAPVNAAVRRRRSACRGPTMLAPGPLDFDRDGRDWPNREASRFVEAAGMRWHVQRMGSGPDAAARARHRRGDPFLARPDAAARASISTVLAPDLPGHGFTDDAGARPVAARHGRAAGRAADGARLRARRRRRPFGGRGHPRPHVPRRRIAPRAAGQPQRRLRAVRRGGRASCSRRSRKLLFLNPLAPRLFAWAADREAVARLLRGTGSPLDARGRRSLRAGCSPIRPCRGRAGHDGELGPAPAEPRPAGPADAGRCSSSARPTGRSRPPTRRARARDAATRRGRCVRHAGHLAHEEKPERGVRADPPRRRARLIAPTSSPIAGKPPRDRRPKPSAALGASLLDCPDRAKPLDRPG